MPLMSGERKSIMAKLFGVVLFLSVINFVSPNDIFTFLAEVKVVWQNLIVHSPLQMNFIAIVIEGDSFLKCFTNRLGEYSKRF